MKNLRKTISEEIQKLMEDTYPMPPEIQNALEVKLKIKTNTYNDSFTSIYQLRTYTLLQLKKILRNVPELEIMNVYNEYYDLSKPIKLNSGVDYAVILLRKN